MHSRIEIVSNGDDMMLMRMVENYSRSNATASNEAERRAPWFFGVIGGVLTRVRFLDMTRA
jgi:hypothetical protein